MLSYQGSLRSRLPVSEQSRAEAMAAMQQPSPYASLGQNHQDALSMLAGRARSALDMEAYRANADYQLRQQQAQAQLALAGLQQQAGAERDDQNLANSRLQSMVGFAGGLLGGLF